MKFGVQINTTSDPIDQLLDLVKLAEDVGFDAVFLTDGLSVLGRGRYDVYAAMALCAQATSRVQLGTCVTNFNLRHPLVTAQALCTIDEFSSGRAVLGIGSGDTPVYAVGQGMMRLAQMAEALHQMRAFMDGETFQAGGVALQSTWRKPRLPICLAADGPKTLQLAGRAADGVIVGSGSTRQVVQWAMERIREGLAEARKDEGEFTVWVNSLLQIADTHERAMEILGDRVLPRAYHNFRRSLNAVPAEHEAEVRRFRDLYIENDRRPEILAKNLSNYTDYLAERFTIAGPAAYCLERLQSLQEIGVDHFIFASQRRDRMARRDLIKNFGERVIPHMK